MCLLLTTIVGKQGMFGSLQQSQRRNALFKKHVYSFPHLSQIMAYCGVHSLFSEKLNKTDPFPWLAEHIPVVITNVIENDSSWLRTRE